jgi:hypothetical protein
MTVKKVRPQPIECEPDNPLEPKHVFDATKVYIFTDSQGHELAVVICPKHHVPILAELIKAPQPQRT